MTVVRAMAAGVGGGIVFGMAYGALIFIVAGLFEGQGAGGILGIIIGIPWGGVFGAGFGAALGAVAAMLLGVAELVWSGREAEWVRPRARVVGGFVAPFGLAAAYLVGLLEELDLDSWFFMLPVLLATPVVVWLAPWIVGADGFPSLRMWSRPGPEVGRSLVEDGWRP